MKARIIITCIILCGCTHFMSAQNTITRDMIYKTSVRILSDPSFVCRGALYEVNDSSISISSRRLEDYHGSKVEASRFPVEDIKVIYTYKRGGGIGALKGAAYGVALGALFGLLSGGNAVLRTSDAMFLGAGFGFVVGVPTGFIVGITRGHRKRTPIYGSLDEFNLNKDKLKEYAIKK